MLRRCIATLLLVIACGTPEAPAPEPPPAVAEPEPPPVFAVPPHHGRWEEPPDPAKVPREQKKALAYHEKECKQHQLASCFEVARFYDQGSVVPRDETRAKGYLRIACDGGSIRACHRMATFEPEPASQLEIDYVLGRYHVICNDRQSPDACSLLGDIYRIGDLVRPDPRRAAKLLEKACNDGDAVGCNNLGAMRALGEGGARDPIEAKVLFTKACSRGSREGCVNAGIDPAKPPPPNDDGQLLAGPE